MYEIIIKIKLKNDGLLDAKIYTVTVYDISEQYINNCHLTSVVFDGNTLEYANNLKNYNDTIDNIIMTKKILLHYIDNSCTSNVNLI